MQVTYILGFVSWQYHVHFITCLYLGCRDLFWSATVTIYLDSTLRKKKQLYYSMHLLCCNIQEIIWNNTQCPIPRWFSNLTEKSSGDIECENYNRFWNVFHAYKKNQNYHRVRLKYRMNISIFKMLIRILIRPNQDHDQEKIPGSPWKATKIIFFGFSIFLLEYNQTRSEGEGDLRGDDNLASMFEGQNGFSALISSSLQNVHVSNKGVCIGLIEAAGEGKNHLEQR